MRPIIFSISQMGLNAFPLWATLYGINAAGKLSLGSITYFRGIASCVKW